MDGSDQSEDLLERAKSGDRVSEAVDPVGSSSQRSDGPPRWVRGLLLFGTFALGTGAVGALLTSGEEAFVYSEMVDEVVADPSGHAGRTLRVEGLLQNGSVRFREDPCEWRFALEREGRSMPVEFSQCIVPDTFRDGMGISVTVEGRLREDGTFVATQVIPKCPSRYEMDQRQQAGEAMPHSAPPPPETSSLGAPRPPS